MEEEQQQQQKLQRRLSRTPPPPIPARPSGVFRSLAILEKQASRSQDSFHEPPASVGQMPKVVQQRSDDSHSNSSSSSSSKGSSIPGWKKKLNRLGQIKKRTESRIDRERNSNSFDIRSALGARTMPVSSEELQTTGKLKIFNLRPKYDSQRNLHTLPDIGDESHMRPAMSSDSAADANSKVHQTAELITDVLDVARVSHLRYDEASGMHVGANVPKELLKMLNQKFGLPFRLYHKKVVDGYKSKIPSILIQLKEGLVQNGGLTQEGIFRLASEANETNTVKEQLNNGTFEGTNDVNVYSTLLKVWYRSLPRRILTGIDLDAVVNCNSVNDAQVLLDSVNEPERSCFEWLLDLCCEVVLHRDVNKMDAKNLAIVMSPNLYTPPSVHSGLSMTEQLKMVDALKKYTTFIQLAIHCRMNMYYGGIEAKA